MPDILDLLLNGDPQAAAARQAAMLRNQQQMQTMAKSSDEQGHSLDMLNFAVQNANNPVLAKSMQAMTESQQGRYAPTKLDKGLYVPATGDYVESPGVADENEARRENARLGAASLLAARNEASQARRDAAQTAADARRDTTNVLAATRAATSQAAADRAADKAAADAEKRQNTNMMKFTTQLEKDGIPEFSSALSTAEGTLAKYKPGTLPGYGRVQSSVPNWAATDEMQMVRSDFQGAADILLKARSGAAVTDQEARRFLREVATGVGMSEEAMRHGWALVRKNLDAKVSNALAAVDDETLGIYNSRTSRPFARPAAPKPTTPTAAPAAPKAPVRMKFDAQGKPVQ